MNPCLRARHDFHIQPWLQFRYPLHEFSKVYILLLWRRKFREACIRLQETTERIGARCNRVQSTARIVLPVRRGRIAAQQRFQAGGKRLDRGKRIIHFVAEHANQSLPGAAFFFAQRATEIRQHEQFMRQALLPKRAPSNSPTTGASGKAERKRFVLVNIVTGVEAKFLCAFAQQFVHWLAEQSFASAINETQTPFWIESENRNVDFPQDRAQPRRRVKGTQALQAQRFAERVNLQKDFSQCV